MELVFQFACGQAACAQVGHAASSQRLGKQVRGVVIVTIHHGLAGVVGEAGEVDMLCQLLEIALLDLPGVLEVAHLIERAFGEIAAVVGGFNLAPRAAAEGQAVARVHFNQANLGVLVSDAHVHSAGSVALLRGNETGDRRGAGFGVLHINANRHEPRYQRALDQARERVVVAAYGHRAVGAGPGAEGLTQDTGELRGDVEVGEARDPTGSKQGGPHKRLPHQVLHYRGAGIDLLLGPYQHAASDHHIPPDAAACTDHCIVPNLAASLHDVVGADHRVADV